MALFNHRSGYLTIIYVLICIMLFFGFEIDFYQRKNPKVVFNSLLTDYAKVYVSNKNYTFAYRIEDTNGSFYKDTSIALLSLNYYSYIKT